MKRWHQYVLEILVILLALSAGYGYGYSQGHNDGKKGLFSKEVVVASYQAGIDKDAERIAQLEVVKEHYVEMIIALDSAYQKLKAQTPMIETQIVYKDNPIQPKEFPDLPTLKTWYETNKIGVLLLPTNGNIDLTKPNKADCDDYASYLQALAFRDGYILDKQLVGAGGYLFDVYVGKQNHEGCIATIGNDIYYVESDGEPLIKWICHKD